jgi:hypothetical protein
MLKEILLSMKYVNLHQFRRGNTNSKTSFSVVDIEIRRQNQRSLVHLIKGDTNYGHEAWLSFIFATITDLTSLKNKAMEFLRKRKEIIVSKTNDAQLLEIKIWNTMMYQINMIELEKLVFLFPENFIFKVSFWKRPWPDKRMKLKMLHKSGWNLSVSNIKESLAQIISFIRIFNFLDLRAKGASDDTDSTLNLLELKWVVEFNLRQENSSWNNLAFIKYFQSSPIIQA